VTGGVLAASLLAAAVGLATAFHPWRTAAAAALVCAVAAAAAAAVAAQTDPSWPVRAAIWGSLALTAGAAILARRGVPGSALGLLALNAGAWGGAAVGLRAELPAALASGLLAVPAALLVRRGQTLPIRIVASWLITIGVLNAAIPILVPTPGYERDHLG
jgi:hypothetical protein